MLRSAPKPSPLVKPPKEGLQRKTRMKSGGRLPAKRKGPPRRGRRIDKELRAYVRRLPCVICETYWPQERSASFDPEDDPPIRSEACHVITWAVSGYDEANLYPGCRLHHQQQHDMGIESFQELHKIDLAAVAAALDAQYRKESGK